MTIAELKKLIRGLPEDTEVLIPAPESGFRKVTEGRAVRAYKITDKRLTYMDGQFDEKKSIPVSSRTFKSIILE